MPRIEENRYLPVFVLLALIITLQSFLIGEDRKQGDLDRPVVSQQTPFIAPRARAISFTASVPPRVPSSPPLSIAGTGADGSPERGDREPRLAAAERGDRGEAPANMEGPATADSEPDGGWVRYQAGASMPDDDLDEPPVMAPSAAPTAAAGDDEATALAEETVPDDAIDPVMPLLKDEWARPGSLQEIIKTEIAPASAKEPAVAPPASEAQPPVAVARTGPTTCEVDIGDNLWRIARRFQVSPEEILKANKLSSGVLLPGQVLTIPASTPAEVPKGFEATRVREGETAIDVANRIGVPLIDLVRENDLASLYQIPAGTLLRYRKPGLGPMGAPPAVSTNPEKTGLSFPVAGRVGDRFGWRMHPILGETMFHTGIDLKANRGEPIRASQDGRVIYAGWLRGYGQTLVIRHGAGYTTRYAHCSALLKKKGEMVRRGEKVARVGSSGRSTGPHVHFEVRHLGRPLNPLKFLKRGRVARS